MGKDFNALYDIIINWQIYFNTEGSEKHVWEIETSSKF